MKSKVEFLPYSSFPTDGEWVRMNFDVRELRVAYQRSAIVGLVSDVVLSAFKWHEDYQQILDDCLKSVTLAIEAQPAKVTEGTRNLVVLFKMRNGRLVKEGEHQKAYYAGESVEATKCP